MVTYGIPTLIELETVEQHCAVCAQLGLKFVELNTNFPRQQLHLLDADKLQALTKQYGIKTVASMNPVMIDGTGMCGGCRLSVGGKTKFACVDGPEFDAHEIDFDEAIERSSMYHAFERHRHEDACNLFRKEDK